MAFWDRFVEDFQSTASVVAAWVPRVALALLVLIIGRFILGLLRRVVVRLLEVRPVQVVFERAGLTSALEPTGQTPARLAGTIIYAILMVVLWVIVFDILELHTIVALLQRLLAWIPLVLLAAAVVIVAAAVGSWVRDLIRPFAQARNVDWLPGAVRGVIVLVGVLTAFDMLGITFAEDIVKIVIGGIVVTFAVAFGIGGIDTAKRWWARYLNPPTGGGGTGGLPPA